MRGHADSSAVLIQQVPDVSGIIERLLIFLETGYDHIQAEALIQMKDLLRRYPDMAEVCIAQLVELNPASISEPEAKAALLWIIGQFGQHIQVSCCYCQWLYASVLSLLQGLSQFNPRKDWGSLPYKSTILG